jgi:folate-dependent phosphoribosylglycinamide formyltransferase PurN
MKIVLLTTDTTHHTFYAWQLSQYFPLQAIFVETRCWKPPFETFHSFEELRDNYERSVLLADFKGTLADVAETHIIESVNNNASVAALQAYAPDVLLIFGTGKLHSPVIEIPSAACLNLHGGNPEHYRGLDTHLWAIYHRDFENLVSTLHKVEAEFDTGDIVSQAQLELKKTTKLHELRAINTGACVQMSVQALSCLQLTGSVPSRKQLSRGRYYSSMPSVLKADCLKKFEQYVSQL